MMKALLLRTEMTSKATRGCLIFNTMMWQTLELPWQDNERNISCIPEGTYDCVSFDSPKFGRVFRITKVPCRSNILIHIGNYIENTLGCVLPGLRASTRLGIPVVYSSRLALNALYEHTKMESFSLTIEERILA